MAEPHATSKDSDEQSEKKHGDKLAHVLDQGTRLSSDADRKAAESTPQDEPLK